MLDAQQMQHVAEQLKASEKARHSASKYDFVKVKVWVGENLAHYYVLSRFLISRMLTVTKVPQMKAVKIALEVKKYLVDNDFLDISQDHFEAILFNVMRTRGFDDAYVRRYKMVTQFFQQRRPLIVLICGVPCTGKSTLAQQLASRLNMPNVLQTDAIYELMRTAEGAPLERSPLWDRKDLSREGLVLEYLRECRVVRKGLDGNLLKCIADGKSIVMEGVHLDPGLYLYEFGRYGQQAHLQQPGVPAAHPPMPSSCLHGATADAHAQQRSVHGHGHASGGGIEPAGAESSLREAGEGCGPLPPAYPGQRAGKDPRRRSASFMLSPSSGAGRMSPVLARASDLAVASVAAATRLHRDNGSTSACMALPADWASTASERGLPCRGPDQATAASSHSSSFLSLSPTMQWLQVASTRTRSNGNDLVVQAICTSTADEQQSSSAHSESHHASSLYMQLSAEQGAAETGVASAPLQVNEGGSGAGGVDGGSHGTPATSRPAQRREGERMRPVSSGSGPEAAAGGQPHQQWRGPSGAGAGLPQQRSLKPGPVFVPIVLCMDDDDHKLLLSEMHAREAGAGRTGEGGADRTLRTLDRLRALQEHLCGYALRAVPVVKLELADFNAALDRLHDYLLLCIQMAMEPEGA